MNQGEGEIAEEITDEETMEEIDNSIKRGDILDIKGKGTATYT